MTVPNGEPLERRWTPPINSPHDWPAMGTPNHSTEGGGARAPLRQQLLILNAGAQLREKHPKLHQTGSG
jgi:hypothetical protein